MTDKMTKDGGPIHPFDRDLGDHPGMSLRDWFAGQALAGELASWAGAHGDPANYSDEIVRRCYKIADAMLAERGKE